MEQDFYARAIYKNPSHWACALKKSTADEKTSLGIGIKSELRLGLAVINRYHLTHFLIETAS